MGPKMTEQYTEFDAIEHTITYGASFRVAAHPPTSETINAAYAQALTQAAAFPAQTRYQVKQCEILDNRRVVWVRLTLWGGES